MAEDLTLTEKSSRPNPTGLRWQAFLKEGRDYVAGCNAMPPSGHLTKVTGLMMEAVGLQMPVGSTCEIHLPNARIEAEVVGFSGEKLFLMPENDVAGLIPGARVMPVEPAHALTLTGKRRSPRRRMSDHAKHMPVGDMLLGRVLDGAGKPLDQLGPLQDTASAPLQSRRSVMQHVPKKFSRKALSVPATATWRSVSAIRRVQRWRAPRRMQIAGRLIWATHALLRRFPASPALKRSQKAVMCRRQRTIVY